MICTVCENGWILFGKQTAETENTISLEGASVVRRWDNGRGIGGIAKAEYRHEYKLDEIGEVEIRKDKILFTIPCEEEE